MNKKYGKLRHGIKQPWLDDFVTACAVDTIKNKKPDLTLIHLVDMDYASPLWGSITTAKEALHRLDKRVAKIIQATKDTGTYPQTDFVILGDHYQINVDKMIHLNMLVFAQQGLLHPLGKKSTYRNNWQVTAQNSAMEKLIFTLVVPWIEENLSK